MCVCLCAQIVCTCVGVYLCRCVPVTGMCDMCLRKILNYLTLNLLHFHQSGAGWDSSKWLGQVCCTGSPWCSGMRWTTVGWTSDKVQLQITSRRWRTLTDAETDLITLIWHSRTIDANNKNSIYCISIANNNTNYMKKKLEKKEKED
ncbi:unnamed protein product [Arctogadus glacialis]